VREDFADEEDFVKAGGSELLYVQMQQNKHMDEQSKIADKVLSLFSLFYCSDLRKFLCNVVHIFV